MPPFLSISHCNFYGTRCVTTHNELSFPRLIRPLSRELVSSLFAEKLIKISSAILLMWPYKVHPCHHKKFTWLSFSLAALQIGMYNQKL